MNSHPAPTPEDYPLWLNNRVAAELKQRRLARPVSAYALAVRGVLSDQQIRNIEEGRHSPSLRNLALLCQRLGTTVEEVILAAVRRE